MTGGTASPRVEVYARDGRFMTFTRRNALVRILLKGEKAKVFRRRPPFAIQLTEDGDHEW